MSGARVGWAVAALGLVAVALPAVAGASLTPAPPVIGLAHLSGTTLTVALASSDPDPAATYQWTVDGVAQATTTTPGPAVISDVNQPTTIDLAATETLSGVTSPPALLEVTVVSYTQGGRHHLIANDLFDPKADLASVNLAGASLAGIDLAGANLDRTDLAGADLAGADLASGYLYETNLKRANLTGADLDSANIFGSHLDSADLTGTDGPASLTGTVGQNAWFYGADLAGVTMEHDNFSAANFVKADLAGATLESSKFVLAEFLKASAPGATFDDVDFEGDNLMWTDLEGAVFEGSTSDFEHANFSNASMQHASLAGLQLTDAIFKQVRLIDADADGATMVHNYFGWADLRGSSFVGANVEQSFWRFTVCPDGHNSGPRGSCHDRGGGL